MHIKFYCTIYLNKKTNEKLPNVVDKNVYLLLKSQIFLSKCPSEVLLQFVNNIDTVVEFESRFANLQESTLRESIKISCFDCR